MNPDSVAEDKWLEYRSQDHCLKHDDIDTNDQCRQPTLGNSQKAFCAIISRDT